MPKQYPLLRFRLLKNRTLIFLGADGKKFIPLPVLKLRSQFIEHTGQTTNVVSFEDTIHELPVHDLSIPNIAPRNGEPAALTERRTLAAFDKLIKETAASQDLRNTVQRYVEAGVIEIVEDASEWLTAEELTPSDEEIAAF